MSITRKRSSKSPNTSSKSPTLKNNEYNKLNNDDLYHRMEEGHLDEYNDPETRRKANLEDADRTHLVDDLMIPPSGKFSHKTLPDGIKIYKRMGDNSRTIKQRSESPFKRRNRRARRTEKREMKKANKKNQNHE